MADETGNAGAGTGGLEQTRTLDRFLADVERRALRLASIATGNTEEALDIVQDAMLKLVHRYPNRSEEEWGLLFQRILQNTIRDWHRRSRIRNYLRIWSDPAAEPDTDGIENLPDGSARDPERTTCNDHALAVLEQALRALPLRQQQVFLLRAWEGLDVARTAAVMGCSQGSVKTHYSRAVHKLRALLGEHWP